MDFELEEESAQSVVQFEGVLPEAVHNALRMRRLVSIDRSESFWGRDMDRDRPA